MASSDPKDDMGKLIGLGKDIKNLMDNVKKDVQPISSWHWLSPTDEKTNSTTAEDIARALKGKEKHLLKDIIAACREKGRKVLIRFPKLKLQEVPNCPDLDDINLALMKESFFTTVHNLSGYNYSVEYAHIYRARSDKSFFPLDVFTVCQRGLLSIEPFMKKELAAEYANFMIRAAYWEYVKARPFADAALSECFPRVLAEAGELSFGSTRIYIGQHPATSTLSFFIRTTCALKSLSDSTGDEREEEAEAAGQFSFVTYKRYELTAAALEAADEIMSFADSSDSAGKKTSAAGAGDESVVFMMVQPEVDEAAAGTIEEQEEQDDLDAGAMRAAHHRAAAAGGRTAPLAEQVFNNAAARQPSPCSELMVWGQNNFLATGTKAQTVADPWPMARPLSLCLEIVKMVACSARHTLVLTSLGLVYSCGDGTEGALGSGDIESRHHLQVLSQWYAVPPTSTTSNEADAPRESSTRAEPRLAESPPVIVKIAAAAGIIGSHSVALDENGNLYSWGVAQATGHGVMKPVLTPRQIDTFPIPQSSNKGDPQERVDAERSARTFYYSRGVRAVSDVACGSGFTSCVPKDTGEVCCWGIWQHGRLGRPVPIIQTSTGRRRLFRGSAPGAEGKKTYARYQLRPLLVPGIRNAASVACGDAHTLCKTVEGYVLAWGQNSCGQLGTGVTRSGFLRDNYRPTYVAPFCPPSTNTDPKESGRKVTLVACGTFHSAAIEEGGAVWTWGARGHPCLGHDDAPLIGPWAKKIQVIFAAATNTTKLMIPYELIPWCSTWSVPRCLDSLANKFRDAPSGNVLKSTRIVQIACGDMHSAFLSATGRVFLCGDGPVVPPIVTAAPQPAEDADGDAESSEHVIKKESDEQEQDAGTVDSTADASLADEKKDSKPKKESKKDPQKEKKEAADDSEDEDGSAAPLPDTVSMIHVPRCPSSAWMSRLATRRTLLIASAGTHMFALQDDDMVASSISKKVYLTLQSEQEQVQYAEDLGAKVIGVPGTEEVVVELDDDEGDFTDMSVGASSGNRSNKSLFEQRGCADCMLISSGKILLAHRAVLAVRSPVLRDKLVEEAPGGDDYNQPTQILLPELLHGTARILLQYLYTDNLPKRLLGNPSMLRNLARAAVQLKIPRLQIMCHQLLQLHASTSRSKHAEDDDSVNSRTAGIGMEVVPATLARDFGSMVGDPQYADIRFIAEGRTLFAHRAILEARSVYFRSMFRSGMMESFIVNGKPTDIVVPDSFVCLLRLMIFIYTDILPEGSDSALLEDLMTADRYQMTDMRCLCENMLVPSKNNWVELLQVAEVIHSSRLKHETIGFLRNHLGEAYVSGSIDESFEHFPDVLESILKMRQIAFPTPPSKLLIEQITTNVKLEEERNKVEFPWVGLVIIAVIGFVFTYLIKVSTLGPLIPWVNGTMMVAVMFYAYKRVLSM